MDFFFVCDHLKHQCLWVAIRKTPRKFSIISSDVIFDYLRKKILNTKVN